MDETTSFSLDNKIELHTIMNISYLPKTGGARMKDVSTFTCKENDLIGISSIKTADEVDEEDFVHVLLSKIVRINKKVVVKIHMAESIFAIKEVKALKTLSNYRNTVKYICDFTCMDNINRWQRPIDKSNKQKMCSSGSNKLHFIVMEYIEDGDLATFLKEQTQHIDVLKSFFLQTAYTIIEIGKIYQLSQGDINSGNILVVKTSKSKLTYTVLDTKTIVKTYGFLPVFIDYGRSYFYEKNVKPNASIIDDILMAFNVYSRWLTSPKLQKHIIEFIANELRTNTKQDIARLLVNIEQGLFLHG